MKKLLLIGFGLAFLSLFLFLLFGEKLEFIFSYGEFVKNYQGLGYKGAIVAIIILIADILLPFPATGIMAAMGKLYGVFFGGFLAFIGSYLAGVIAYMVARYGARKFAHKISSEEELASYNYFYNRWGGLAIILSRALPILPEVTSILAGFACMRLSKFLLALLFGTLPTALFFAYLGSMGDDNSFIGIIVAVILPAIIWWPITIFIKAKQKRRGF
ncbi:MAG: TVP38/TMEM64 family protein [Lentisphaeria bacterium]